MLIGPPSASLEEFDFRVSMAVVESDGPFSSFPGVDRQLLILRGNGLALKMPGREESILAVDGAPFAFAGELPVMSRRLGSDVTDFNVMTRRGVFEQSLRRVALAPGEMVFGESDMTLLIPVHVDMPYSADEYHGVLAPFDAILLEKGESIRNRSDAPTRCLLLLLERSLGLPEMAI